MTAPAATLDLEVRVPCPVPSCQRRFPAKWCLCVRHWDMVPSHIRRRVVEAQRRGLGPFVRCTDCEFQAQEPDEAIAHIRANPGHLAKVIGPPDGWPTAEYLAAAAEAVASVMAIIGAPAPRG